MDVTGNKSRSCSDCFGWGCFWCTEAVFLQVRGVLAVESGYSNGHLERPRYEAVCTGATGHAEVVRLVYDPREVSTRELLEVFFLVHDPTTPNRQGARCRYPIPQRHFLDPSRAGAHRKGSHCRARCQRALHAAHRDRSCDSAELLACRREHQNFFARNPQQAYCLQPWRRRLPSSDRRLRGCKG